MTIPDQLAAMEAEAQAAIEVARVGRIGPNPWLSAERSRLRLIAALRVAMTAFKWVDASNGHNWSEQSHCTCGQAQREDAVAEALAEVARILEGEAK